MECPKCASEMRSYERNGITVDQCTGCRGLFLDRGELERLTEAEGAYYERATPPPSRPPEPRRDYEDRYESRKHESYGHGHGYGHGKKRKKGFLDEFLDFG